MKVYQSADIVAMDQRFRTTFINSLSGFKSLQMVATINKNGSTNIALFNSIFHICANPPLLGMVVRPDGTEHETFKNIFETGFYTLNNVKEGFYKEAHQTSARYIAGESEFKQCGFKEHFENDFIAPFVAEASIKLGMQLREIIPVAINGCRIVIAEIVKIIIEDDLIAKDGYVNQTKAETITVAGLDAYFNTQLINRLAYAKPEKQAEPINVI